MNACRKIHDFWWVIISLRVITPNGMLSALWSSYYFACFDWSMQQYLRCIALRRTISWFFFRRGVFIIWLSSLVIFVFSGYVDTGSPTVGSGRSWKSMEMEIQSLLEKLLDINDAMSRCAASAAPTTSVTQKLARHRDILHEFTQVYVLLLYFILFYFFMLRGETFLPLYWLAHWWLLFCSDMSLLLTSRSNLLCD